MNLNIPNMSASIIRPGIIFPPVLHRMADVVSRHSRLKDKVVQLKIYMLPLSVSTPNLV